jgi:2-aminoethylphosphonate-pyruvate transaminase
MDANIMRQVVSAAADSLTEMGVDTAAPPAAALDERAKLAA